MRSLAPMGFASTLLALIVIACVGDDPQVSPLSFDGGGVGVGASSGAGACTAEQKACAGNCVSRSDPAVGCGSASCEPCLPGANADATCTSGACSLACKAGFGDCDGDPKTGCETNAASDTAHCGACGNACGAANTETTPTCETGTCKLTCKAHFAHCGTNDATGCETNTATSPDNCGSCGHSCLGGECKDGRCQPFRVASVDGVNGLAIDDKHIYMTRQSAGIVRVGRDGKCPGPCPETFVGAPADNIAVFRGSGSPATDGAALYFSVGRVSRRLVTETPGTAMTVFDAPGDADIPGAITIAGGHVYWVNSEVGTDAPFRHLLRAKLDGTEITPLADYPSATFEGFGAIVADATHVYWTAEHSGLYRRALASNAALCVEGAGTACEQLAQGGAGHLAIDDQFVYFTNPYLTQVESYRKESGTRASVASDLTGISGLAALDGYVYVAANQNQKIVRRSRTDAACSSNCEVVAAGDVAADVTAIVAASDGIYFANAGAAAPGVYRIAK